MLFHFSWHSNKNINDCTWQWTVPFFCRVSWIGQLSCLRVVFQKWWKVQIQPLRPYGSSQNLAQHMERSLEMRLLSLYYIFSLLFQQRVQTIHDEVSEEKFTSGQKQDVIHVLVHRLNSVHGYLGIVVVANIKWSCSVHGVNPVSHFGVILHHRNCGSWQCPALCWTLQNTYTQRFFFGSSLHTVQSWKQELNVCRHLG